MGDIYRVGDLVEMQVKGDFDKTRGAVLFVLPDDLQDSCFIQVVDSVRRGVVLLVAEKCLRKVWLEGQIERADDDPGPVVSDADVFYYLHLFVAHNKQKFDDQGYDCYGIEGEDFGPMGIDGAGKDMDGVCLFCGQPRARLPFYGVVCVDCIDKVEALGKKKQRQFWGFVLRFKPAVAELMSYCTQNFGDCFTCSLVNYGRDCQNNPIFDRILNKG